MGWQMAIGTQGAEDRTEEAQEEQDHQEEEHEKLDAPSAEKLRMVHPDTLSFFQRFSGVGMRPFYPFVGRAAGEIFIF